MDGWSSAPDFVVVVRFGSSAVGGVSTTALSNEKSGWISNFEPIDCHPTSGCWTTAQICLQGSFLLLKSMHWHDGNWLSEPSQTWYFCTDPWTIKSFGFCLSISEALISEFILLIICSTMPFGRLCKYFGTRSSYPLYEDVHLIFCSLYLKRKAWTRDEKCKVLF